MMDGWMDGWMDGQMDGWTHELMDGHSSRRAAWEVDGCE